VCQHARRHLRAANLEDGRLPQAILKGADLRDANLQESKDEPRHTLEPADISGPRRIRHLSHMHMKQLTACPCRLGKVTTYAEALNHLLTRMTTVNR